MEQRKIGFELKCLTNLFKRNIDALPTASEVAKLTGMHGSIIGFIAHTEGPVYQSDVEKRFTMRRSTASRILQLMEKKELIYRRDDENDGRRKQLFLTEKAQEYNKLIEKEIESVEKRLVEGLTETEIENLLGTIEKMKANLSKCDEKKGNGRK